MIQSGNYISLKPRKLYSSEKVLNWAFSTYICFFFGGGGASQLREFQQEIPNHISRWQIKMHVHMQWYFNLTNLNSMITRTEGFHCPTDVRCIPSFFHPFFPFHPILFPGFWKPCVNTYWGIFTIVVMVVGEGAQSGAGPDRRWLTIDLECVCAYLSVHTHTQL